MADPCDRKRCPGHLVEWATELRPDGTSLAWLVCDRDSRHTVERDTAPIAGEEQDALPGLGDARG